MNPPSFDSAVQNAQHASRRALPGTSDRTSRMPSALRGGEIRSRRGSMLDVLFAVVAAAGAVVADAHGAGTLTPKSSSAPPIEIRDHHLAVVINNGFSRSEVTQTFFNPGTADVEAIYAFPVPRSASLSEVTIHAGEEILQGEVVRRTEAERIYEEQKSEGADAGMARRDGWRTFEFLVSRVPAQSETRVSFVYYQPLEIDSGVGRYLYPLHHGGNEMEADAFWTRNERVERGFTAEVEIKSAVPIDDVRAPGHENGAVISRVADGHWTLAVDSGQMTLDRDFIVYYRLPENLPGRVDVFPYRADTSAPGTFMAVVTPGIDLAPITRGSDWCFVLDVSGSMDGVIHTLAEGVSRAIGSMRPDDRFRVITFNDRAREIVPWTAAAPESVASALEQVRRISSSGGTNVFEGLALALKSLDADRATSIVLVTDGVANTGVVQPRAFQELLSKHDLRVFGFLLGNSANWPLMQTIAQATGGFHAAISSQDDIAGQLMLARSKVTHESLHDAALSIRGVRTFDTTDEVIGKIYRGQQLVVFGRYAEPGHATLTLKASLTGEDRTYTTTFDFPELDTDDPEIERLFGLNRIEQIEFREHLGMLPAAEASEAIASLGVEYQLVTDHTSMIVLSDAAHERYGIDRRNRGRAEVERDARTARASQPVRSRRVDTESPMFPGAAPSIGGGNGGGAISPFGAAVMVVVVGAAVVCGRRRAIVELRDGAAAQPRGASSGSPGHATADRSR